MSNDFSNEDFQAMLGEIENEKANGTFKSPYWKPQNDGAYKIRIINPLKQFGEKVFYQKHKFHYINGRAYFCLNQTLTDKNGDLHEAEACPICAKVKSLYNSSEKGSLEWEEAGKIRAKDRYVSRIIVRGNKDKDGNDIEAKPEFWEFGQKIHDYFFYAIKMGEYGNFLSLKDGRDYNLVKKGTGRNTNYDGSGLSPVQSMVFTDKDKVIALSENLPKMNYNQLVEFVSYEELSNALNEQLNKDSEEDIITEKSEIPSTLDNILSNPMSAPVKEEPKEEENIDDLLKMLGD